MQFDDRLSTILAVCATGPHDRAVRWRQLVDLVARSGPRATGPLIEQALAEIRSERDEVAEPLRAAAARAIAGRPLLAALLELFASDTLEVAAPLLSAAKPDDALRAAASPEARRFLEAMHSSRTPPGISDVNSPPAGPPASQLPSISDLLDRLEKLSAQRAVDTTADPAPPLPAPRVSQPEPVPAYDLQNAPALFRWECGPGGNIGWVDGAPRGALVGRSIARSMADDGVDREVERAFARRAPFREAGLALPEAGILAGRWLISGVPAFAPADGRFVGYRGIARRAEALAIPVVSAKSGPLDPAALRELVHEIKTPLNAIIGFAEIIDGQYLGPAQSGYRAKAAEIVVQARILLAGVDDLDFAARVRGRNPGEGSQSDFEEFFGSFAERLAEQAGAIGVKLAVDAPPAQGLCTLDRELAERLLGRFTEAVLGAAEPGETLHLAVRREDGFCALRLSRPRKLEGLNEADLFNGGNEGVDFALRMAFGLAQIVGGRLGAEGSDLVLRMPMTA